MLSENYIKELLNNNQQWVKEQLEIDPEVFVRAAQGQEPKVLWLGCSDSRVPPNEVTGTNQGDFFVHRNIANLVIHTDLNALSVISYAIEVLKVKHIIVCGHYGCGGIRAAMTNSAVGFVDNWLRNIKDVYAKHSVELDAILDLDKRADRLTELNVIEQVKNLCRTKKVQKAWKERLLQVHGWVYGLNSGLVKDLEVVHDEITDIEPIYRYDL
jgi:carbonic anhydrase